MIVFSIRSKALLPTFQLHSSTPPQWIAICYLIQSPSPPRANVCVCVCARKRATTQACARASAHARMRERVRAHVFTQGHGSTTHVTPTLPDCRPICYLNPSPSRPARVILCVRAQPQKRAGARAQARQRVSANSCAGKLAQARKSFENIEKHISPTYVESPEPTGRLRFHCKKQGFLRKACKSMFVFGACQKSISIAPGNEKTEKSKSEMLLFVGSESAY